MVDSLGLCSWLSDFRSTKIGMRALASAHACIILPKSGPAGNRLAGNTNGFTCSAAATPRVRPGGGVHDRGGPRAGDWTKTAVVGQRLSIPQRPINARSHTVW